MNARLLTAAFVAATLLAAPAFADDLVVEASAGNAYYTDSSYDAISDRNATSNLGIGAAWAFGNLRLGLQYEATPRARTSRFASNLDLEWSRHRALGSVDWGVPIWSWFRPHVHGTVGYSHQFLQLVTSGPRLKDHAHDLAASLAGGVEFSLGVPLGRLGLTTRVGYEYQTAANFDELRHDKKAFDQKYAPDEDPWDRARADFGTLTTNGVFWTVGANFAFDF